MTALRAQVWDLSGGMCEWPYCLEAAAELAHLHSTGMGGRPSAHTLDNVAAMCWAHARVSDGLTPGTHGRQWHDAQIRLLGLEPGVKAWVIAEALRTRIAQGRPGVERP